jgi:probable F420-dependent oxidoreductase
MMTQPPRFGLAADFGSDLLELALQDPDGWCRELVEAEQLGYHLIALSDHLHSVRSTLEPFVALSYGAAATTRLRLLTDVLGLPYRHPAVVAKMAETLSRLSRGRFILGLGNGGYDEEFAAFGLPIRPPREKVDALEEAVDVIRALWADVPITLSGNYFQLSEASIAPRPTTTIPIWLGSYGPRGLRQVARCADGWLPSIGRISLDTATAGLATVRAAAIERGRNPDTLTFACNYVAHRLDESTVAEIVAIARAGFTTIVVAGLADRTARHTFATEIIHEVSAALAAD